MPDRRWACGLLRQLGTWKKVLLSQDYKRIVKPLYDTVFQLVGCDCEEWPEGADPAYDAYRGRNICFICQNPESA